MVIKVFLDTNIIMDLLDAERPFHADAKMLYKSIEDEKLQGYVSESIITTTDYILQKKIERTKRTILIDELLSFIQILPCNNSICQKAIRTQFEDLEDALLYQIALENKLNFYITNDSSVLKKLSSPLLPVASSKKFLKTIE